MRKDSRAPVGDAGGPTFLPLGPDVEEAEDAAPGTYPEASQPAPTPNHPGRVSPSGRIWLITGGIVAGVFVVLFMSLISVQPGWGLTGAVGTAFLYAVMIPLVFMVTVKRVRLVLLSALLAAMLVFALICVLMMGLVGPVSPA